MNNHKLVFNLTELNLLQNSIEVSIISLQERINVDIKEISVYRLHDLCNLYKRFRSKTIFQEKKKVVMKFDTKEMLSLRYALINQKNNIYLNQIFNKIDSVIHPNMFMRN